METHITQEYWQQRLREWDIIFGTILIVKNGERR